MRELLKIIISEHTFRRAVGRVDPESLERWKRAPRGIRAGVRDEVRASLLLDRCSPAAPTWAEYTRTGFLYVLDGSGDRCWVVREYRDCLLVVTVLLRYEEPEPPKPPDDAYRLRPGLVRRETRPPRRLSC